jgi:hypothetical protein
MAQCVIAHFQHNEELHDDNFSTFVQVAQRLATLLQVTGRRFSCMIHINQLIGAFQVPKKQFIAWDSKIGPSQKKSQTLETPQFKSISSKHGNICLNIGPAI